MRVIAKMCILIEMNKCARFCHLRASYVRVRARIIMKMDMVVNIHTDSLCFKFYEDPFFGCREIAEINMSMDYSHF